MPTVLGPISATRITYTNQPAALDILLAESNRFVLDTSGFSEIRMSLCITTVGATGARIMARFRTTDSGTAAAWTASAGRFREVEIALDAIAIKDTGWQMLAEDAIGPSRYFAFIGESGDGAADPVFTGPFLYFR